MVNEFSFTRFKSSLLESLKGLCEHDTSYAQVWRSIRRRNIQMQPPPPSSKTRVSSERLVEFSTGREASIDPEGSSETSGYRAKAEDSEVDPSSSFVLDPLDDVKLCQGERFRHYSIDDEYLLYKGRVCVPATGDFRAQILRESHDSPSAGHPGIQKTYALVKRQFYWPSLFKDV